MKKTMFGLGVVSTAVVLGLSGSFAAAEKSEQVAVDHPQTATSSPTEIATPEAFEYVIVAFLEHNTTKIAFDKGTADLTDIERDHLADFVHRMRDEGQVRKFLLAAWSDDEYPADGKELTSSERKLAKQRSDNVKKALQNAGAGTVETFLMTSQPNWLQKTFATDAAKVKGGPDIKLTNDATQRVGTKLRDRGGPSTVVVGAMFNDNSYAH